MNHDEYNAILNKVIIVGFSIYVLGAVVSVALMNIGLGLACLAWLIKKIKTFDFKLPTTPYDKYILFFILALVLSLLDSVNLSRSLDDFKRLWIPILLFYIVVDSQPNLKVIKKWLAVLFVTMGGSIIYAFVQYYQSVGRVHANIFVMEFASLLTFMALYTIIYACLGEIKLSTKLLLGVTSILTLAALVFTKTRGAWLAFIISLSSILFLRNKKYLIYFLVIAILFLALAPTFVPQEYINRFISIFDLEHNKSNITRLNLWRGALLIYQDYYINGIGLNNFSKVIHREPYLHQPINSDAHAHNVFLQLAAETGTLGVGAFILLFGLIIRSLTAYYQSAENKNLKLFFLGSVGVIISYLSHGLTEYNLPDMYVSRLVWFILAISVILKKKYNLKLESD